MIYTNGERLTPELARELAQAGMAEINVSVNGLLERRPDDARVTPGVWDTPGGHQRPDETPAETLARELREELGIAVASPRLLAAIDRDEPPDGARYRHFVYVVREWRGEVAARGRQLEWFRGLRTALDAQSGARACVVPRAIAVMSGRKYETVREFVEGRCFAGLHHLAEHVDVPQARRRPARRVQVQDLDGHTCQFPGPRATALSSIAPVLKLKSK